MRAHAIGVVRSASTLDELIYSASQPSDPARPWQQTHTCQLRPLPTGSHPDLVAAWCALARVTEWNERVTDAVLTVVTHSVPWCEPPSGLPAVGFRADRAAHGTAAHPRGFRGTKVRPPRAPRPPTLDLRPYLVTRRWTDRVLAALAQPTGVDPYLAVHHDDADAVRLEPSFVSYCLPLLRGCRWSVVCSFAAHARALKLSEHPDLRAALIGVLLGARQPDRALGWWSHVLGQPAGERLVVAHQIVASGVAARPVVGPETAASIGELSLDHQWAVYRGLARGASFQYLSSGIALDALSAVTNDEPPGGQRDVTAIVDEVVMQLVGATSDLEFWRRHLWWLCGTFAPVIDLLIAVKHAQLTPKATYALVQLVSSPWHDRDTAAATARVLARHLPAWLATATRLDVRYQHKYLADISQAWWSIRCDDRAVADDLAICDRLAQQLARPPMATTPTLGIVLGHLARLARDGRPLTIPDESLRVLETRCRRDNQARIVSHGLCRLVDGAPRLVEQTLASSPRALLRTADAVATLSEQAAHQVIRTYAARSSQRLAAQVIRTYAPRSSQRLAAQVIRTYTPQSSQRPAAQVIAEVAATCIDRPLDELCRTIAAIARQGGPNPVRRALRDHLRGARVLTQAQLAGHRARIVAALPAVQLAAIRQAVAAIHAKRYGVAVDLLASPTARHAAAMDSAVDVHRRQLRRVVGACLRDDPEWSVRHPRSQSWLGAAPMNAAVWLGRFTRSYAVAQLGEVTLAVETDPLEALKLGTYVGSCLGRGGRLEYSAAAVVLDVNKRVVYARSPSGNVIGRQLVAVSQAHELVCFYVYGSHGEQLERCFADFDREFAAAIGLPIYSDHAAAYQIASILSHDWWDDGAWTGVTS